MLSLIDQMDPRLKGPFQVFSGLMAEARIPFGLNEVLRLKIRQLAYACQGRDLQELRDLLTKYQWVQSLARVNDLASQGKTIQGMCDLFRGESGLGPLRGKEWNKVTWRMNSRHFANAAGLAEAFDIKIFLPGTSTPTWDTKWDADHDGRPEYLEAAELGRKAGLRAGADFGDFPHFELPQGV